MPTVLITGCGRGIGLELARQYAADAWTVLATVRDSAGAEALQRLSGDVGVLDLDVADAASVAILSERTRGTAIDLLINNAGLYGPRTVTLGAIHYPVWLEVLATNTLGPIRLVEAFLDHLRAGDGKTIVNLSSKAGSIADNTSGRGYIYRSSKAALNAATKSLAIDLAPEGFRVAVLHPGWVHTDMGGPNALIDTATSVAGMRRVIDGLTPADSGGFFNYDGSPIPW